MPIPSLLLLWAAVAVVADGATAESVGLVAESMEAGDDKEAALDAVAGVKSCSGEEPRADGFLVGVVVMLLLELGLATMRGDETAAGASAERPSLVVVVVRALLLSEEAVNRVESFMVSRR